MSIQLLNLPTFSDGQSLPAATFNTVVNKINESIQWINLWESSHSSSFDISLATVVGINDKYTYTGEPIVPEFRVYANGVLLSLGKDYDYNISNNTNIGTATLKIVGIGAYTSTKTLTFTIEGVQYNLSYSTEKGTAPQSKKKSVLESTDLTLLTGVSGYTNTGWYYDAAFTQQAKVGDTLTKDTTLYAKWVQSTFTLTYVTAHGSVTQPTAPVAALPSTLPSPTADGYWFIEWRYADGTKANPGDAITANTTLTAKWIDNEYESVLTISGSDGNKTYSLAITKDETADSATKLYLSIDNGTWTEATGQSISLTATTTIKAKVVYGDFETTLPTITAETDADNETLKFTSTKGAVTLTGVTNTDGVINLKTVGACEFTAADSDSTINASITIND